MTYIGIITILLNVISLGISGYAFWLARSRAVQQARVREYLRKRLREAEDELLIRWPNGTEAARAHARVVVLQYELEILG